MGSGSWHCSMRERDLGAEHMSLSCIHTSATDRMYPSGLSPQGAYHQPAGARAPSRHDACFVLACSFWACFNAFRLTVLLRSVCCADGWSDQQCSRFCGFISVRRSSFDDTHVHYGPGGTSNASAYGLQNGRVRCMLGHFAQAAYSASRANPYPTLSMGFAGGWCGRHDCRRRLEGAAG